MSLTRIHIETVGGRVAPTSQDVLKDAIRALSDGGHTIEISPAKTGYTTTRYKYYWDCFVPEVLRKVGRFYRVIDHGTGEQREPRDTQEMHDILKALYNPATVLVGSRTVTIPCSTTTLCDRDFIGQYLDGILTDLANAPYFLEVTDYETWRELRRAGASKRIDHHSTTENEN